ncbi:uncharacterized protein LOC128214451 isoform X2 [Mya arenaria]|nr:uncharacterized protein LOC128214451 isoform X2 [Mya arenaria]XP_052776888.1 uncharacterized protein LOC128214451 isoform X2 [Mya arenaria]
MDNVDGRVQKHCEPCCKEKKTTPASFYCKHCREFLCLECSSQHNRFGFMSDHKIVDWQTEETDEDDVDMFDYDQCELHGACVEIYCEDHDVLICAKCAFIDHKKCKNANQIDEISMNKTIEEFQKQITICNENAKEIIGSFNEIGFKEREEVRAKALKMKSEECAKIDIKLEGFLSAIESAAKDARSSMNHELSAVSNIHVELEQWIRSLNVASKQGLTDKCFILSKSLRTKVMKHEEFLRQQNLDSTSLSIHTEHMFKESGIQQKHDVAVQVNSSDISHQNENTKPIKNTVIRKTVSLQRQVTLSVETYSDNEDPFISGIDFLEDGRLVALDNANNKCLVLGGNLHILGQPFTFFTKPLDICAYKGNQAAVTSGNYIYFLVVDQFNTTRLIRKVSTSASYFSISRFNRSGFLCSAYRDAKAPIREVDFEGNEIDFKDLSFADIKFEFYQSFSAYAEQLGIIILTDFDSNKLYMFNTHTGETICVEDKRIQGPRQVVIGSEETVLVSCEKNSSVCRINFDGQVLQSFEVEMQHPSALCISIDGTKLVVSNRSETMRTIQQYELTYTLNK